MELDELKQSWEALDKRLQRQAVTDDRQIEKLIAGYKANAGKNLKNMYRLQRISVITGVVVVLFTIVAALTIYQEVENPQVRTKAFAALGFMAATFMAGLWWDTKTLKWCRAIRVNEMPVVEVSRRITVFRQWMRYEVWAVGVWAILCNALCYWLMKLYDASALLQTAYIAIMVIIDILIIYLLYKRLLFKYVDKIHKNIEELKDICTE